MARNCKFCDCAAGYEADMILVPANPLEQIEALQDVLMVMSNGRIVLQCIPFHRVQ